MKILPLTRTTHFDAVQALYDDTLSHTEAQLGKEYKRLYQDVLEKTKGIYYELLESEQDGTILTSDYYRFGKNYELAEMLNKRVSEFTGQEKDIFEQELLSMYEKTTKLIGRELGVAPLNDARAIQAANTIWCQDGKLWSQRIWTHRDQLCQMVEQGMLDCVVTGASSKELAKTMQMTFGQGWYECSRLARTELAHIMNQSSIDSYKEAGYNFYKVLTAGDPCPACQDISEQIFPVSQNLLPQHPNCRCCTIAVKDAEQ